MHRPLVQLLLAAAPLGLARAQTSTVTVPPCSAHWTDGSTLRVQNGFVRADIRENSVLDLFPGTDIPATG